MEKEEGLGRADGRENVEHKHSNQMHMGSTCPLLIQYVRSSIPLQFMELALYTWSGCSPQAMRPTPLL